MKPTVYIETSVVGYLTSWPQENVTVAGHQNTTRQWWSTAAHRFELFVSQLVVRESSDGDADAVQDRLGSIGAIPVLPITPAPEHLAEALIRGHAVPEDQPNDALHIALAASHGIQYLVSWNFRHIVRLDKIKAYNASVATRGMIHRSSALPRNCWSPTMIDDPIVNEIRRIRRKYAELFDNDLHAICEDLRRQERESGREFRSPSQKNVDQSVGQAVPDKPA